MFNSNSGFLAQARALALIPLRSAFAAVTVCLSTFALAYAHTEAHAQDAPTALSTYKKYDDPGVADWKASNDKVRTLGGWRTYLKEAYETTPAPAHESQVPAPAAPGRAPPDAADGAIPGAHPHHHHHGGEK